MVLIEIKCAFCGKKYFRSRGRINEARKFAWKQYCSKICQNQAKVTRIEKICANSNCNKKVSRRVNQFRKSKSGNIFCSSHCSAVINNEPRKKIKMCSICGNSFHGENRYCSKICRSKIPNPRKIPLEIYKQKIISRIIAFYNKNNRIPVKKEMYGLYRTTRKLFGTWNKTILAAGFHPNPVMFSKKFIAKDGHKCDSFTEKIIDDWLFSNGIRHKRNIFYPNSRYTADFEVNGKFIEFFGLTGELKEYDKNIKLKEGIAKQNNIKLVKIYPKDLFPRNRLSEIIKI